MKNLTSHREHGIIAIERTNLKEINMSEKTSLLLKELYNGKTNDQGNYWF